MSKTTWEGCGNDLPGVTHSRMGYEVKLVRWPLNSTCFMLLFLLECADQPGLFPRSLWCTFIFSLLALCRGASDSCLSCSLHRQQRRHPFRGWFSSELGF